MYRFVNTWNHTDEKCTYPGLVQSACPVLYTTTVMRWAAEPLAQFLTLSVVNRMILSIHKACVSWREGSANVSCPAATQNHQDLQRPSGIHQLYQKAVF